MSNDWIGEVYVHDQGTKKSCVHVFMCTFLQKFYIAFTRSSRGFVTQNKLRTTELICFRPKFLCQLPSPAAAI